VKHKHLALTLGALITSTLILYSCKKINEATSLGGDLIPPVDNITTFDTTLDVEAYNDTFTILTDTLGINSGQEHFLGQITNDPLFGKTNAKMYLDLLPSVTGSPFINKPDSLNIDSVVLILDYQGTYGDSTVPQTVNVYEISQSSLFSPDTLYRVRKNDLVTTTLLGSRTFLPMRLDDSVKAYQDTTAMQLRIRLDDSFGSRLLGYDTTNSGGHIAAYSSDSAFKKAFNGFALESTGGNAIMGFNLQGANTKLAIYYKDDNNNAPVASWDTAVTYFPFAGNVSAASANLVTRDFSGSPLEAAVNGTTAPADGLVYMQTTPGSFATIKIPGLPGLSNRIVHRAELIAEEAFDPSDLIFAPSNFLYLDAFDPVLNDFRTIPYDVLSDVSGSLNLPAFGVAPVNATDDGGHLVKVWHFNLTRYVQHIVNQTELTYDLRLYSPFDAVNQYKPSNVSVPVGVTTAVNPSIAAGRVRLFGGDPSPVNPNPHRLRLRIVYSKI